MKQISPIIRSMLVAIGIWGTILISWGDVSAQEEVEIDPTFAMNAQYVNPGDVFTAPIDFGTNAPISAIQFDIRFDPSAVQVEGVSEGTFFSAFAQASGGSTSFTPGEIDNQAGRVRGVRVQLDHLPGQGASGYGRAVLLTYHAAGAPSRSYTTIENYHVFDSAGNDLAMITNQVGGLIQVGPGPLLSVTGVRLTPTGQGQDFGRTFTAQFTLHNTDGMASEPTTATVIANAARPLSQTVAIPSIQPDTSLVVELPVQYSIAGGALPGYVASLTVMVSGDGSLTKEYLYQPVIDVQQTAIDGVIQPFIQITVPDQVVWQDLRLGPNDYSGVVNVQCNTSYKVDVYDPHPTIWRMTEWDGNDFFQRRLQDSLHVIGVDQGTDVSGDRPANLITGSVNEQSPDLGKDYPISFQQMRHSSDAALTGGRTYHLILIFSGYILF